MPTILNVEEHLDALSKAVERLQLQVAAAGDGAPVPSCPAWNVRALLAHVVMVHDWADAIVSGSRGAKPLSQTALREGNDDLAAMFATGADRLLTAIREAPADRRAMVFLPDAPPPRAFWARRQAHETTVHAVDATAAALGRLPNAHEVDIPVELAVDGIDELLCGFAPRGRTRWTVNPPLTVLVMPEDAERRWLLRVATEGFAAVPCDIAGPATLRVDAVWRGSASQLYLGLWNRGNELVEEGGGRPFLGAFRQQHRVRW